MSESKPTDKEIYDLFQTFCTPITSSEMGHVVAVAVNAVHNPNGDSPVSTTNETDRHMQAHDWHDLLNHVIETWEEFEDLAEDRILNGSHFACRNLATALLAYARKMQAKLHAVDVDVWDERTAEIERLRATVSKLEGERDELANRADKLVDGLAQQGQFVFGLGDCDESGDCDSAKLIVTLKAKLNEAVAAAEKAERERNRIATDCEMMREARSAAERRVAEAEAQSKEDARLMRVATNEMEQKMSELAAARSQMTKEQARWQEYYAGEVSSLQAQLAEANNKLAAGEGETWEEQSWRQPIGFSPGRQPSSCTSTVSILPKKP